MQVVRENNSRCTLWCIVKITTDSNLVPEASYTDHKVSVVFPQTLLENVSIIF
jgi:hypothetical protein